MTEVVGVDAHASVVFTRAGRIAYDYLVLATGIEYNYFGHEEWKALAPGLASVDDADRISVPAHIRKREYSDRR